MRQTRELWITQVVSPGRCPRPLNDEAPHGALLSLDIVEVFLLPYVSTPPSCSSAFLSLSVIFTSFLYIRSSYINIMCARMRVYYILILFHDAFFIQIRYMHFFYQLSITNYVLLSLSMCMITMTKKRIFNLKFARSDLHATRQMSLKLAHSNRRATYACKYTRFFSV